MVLQVVKEALGQANTTPRSHGLGHLLVAELIKFRALPAGVRRVDQSLPHLLHELLHKDSLNLAADLG
jgi:hypothetical protein